MKLWRFFAVFMACLVCSASWAGAHLFQNSTGNRLKQGVRTFSRPRPATNQDYNIWAKFHQDNNNSGQGYAGGSNGQLRWRQYLGASPVVSSPALYLDGTIMIGSEDHNSYLLNPDGSVKSSFTTGDKVLSSPAIFWADTESYFGSNDGCIYGYVSGNSYAWKYQTGGPVVAPAMITGDNNVIVGSTDHYLYSVGIYGFFGWKYLTGGAITGCAAEVPIVNSLTSLVYFGSEDGYLYCTDSWGTLQWKTHLGGPIDSSPVVGAFGNIYITCTDGKLYSLNSQTGSVNWSFATGGPISTTPALGPDGNLYFGSNDKNFYAVEPLFGRKIWSFAAGDAITSSAAIATDGVLYFGCNDGLLYALKPDGTKQWTYKTGGAIASSPAIDMHGVVYVGSGDGYLYAIGSQATTGTIVSATFSSTNLAPGVPETLTVTLAQPSPPQGTLIAIMNRGGGIVPPFLTVPGGSTTGTCQVAALSSSYGTVSFSVHDDTNSLTVTNGIDVTIAPPWARSRQGQANTAVGLGSGSNGAQAWSFQTQGAIEAAPAIIGDGTVYVASGDGKLYSLYRDGTLKWDYLTGKGLVSTPAIGPDGTVYVNCPDGYVYCLYPSGVLNWKAATEAGGSTSSPVIDPTYNIGYVGVGHSIYQIWQNSNGLKLYQTQGTIESSPVIAANGSIIFGSDDGKLYSINMHGTLLWQFTADSALSRSPSIDSKGNIYVSSSKGTVYSLKSDGTLRWSIALTGIANTAIAIDKGDVLYVGAANGLLYSLNSAGATNWTFSTGGAISSDPAIDAAGVVYASSTDGIFYAINPNGTVKWGYPIGAGSGNPSIGADGTVYLGGPDWQIHALGSISNRIQIQSLTMNPTNVVGGTTATGTVTLSQAAPPEGAVVYLFSSSYSAILPYCIKIPAGQISATFTYSTLAVNATIQVEIDATSGPTPATAQINITPPVPVSVTFSPTSVVGGVSITGTVTISSPAPSNSEPVALSSASPNVMVPQWAVVAAGQTTATFVVLTYPVNTSSPVTVTATASLASVTGNFTITPPSVAAITVDPANVVGGNSTSATVTLSGVAPSNGTTVTLSADNACASPPATVLIPAGSNSVTLPIPTNPVVKATTTVLTATAGGASQQVILTVSPAGVGSLTLSPSTVTGGNPSTGTVTLTGPAPTGNLPVNLNSNNANAIVPGTVTVQAGATTATFTVTTLSVRNQATATLSAALGSSNGTADLTIVPAIPQGLTLNPTTVIAGTPSVGTVTLTGPAPTGGLPVNLSSTSPSASVPSSVTVPAGATTVNFNIATSGVTSQGTAIITAFISGNQAKATLTITPAVVTSITFAPSSVSGGLASTGTVTLNGVAPSSGTPVSLSSSSYVATVPASVTVLGGKSSATFMATTTPVPAPVTVTVTGSSGGSTITGTFSVVPPYPTSVLLNPSTVPGGSPSTGTVIISGSAPVGGVTVTLSSNSPSATPQSTVLVPAGSTTATFSVTTSSVAAQTTASITAQANGSQASGNLTISSANLTGFGLSPATVIGGNPTTATVTLSGPAPSGGTVVSLSTSSGYVIPPATLTVPAGSTSAIVSISTLPVSQGSSATLVAKLGSTTQSANLTLLPVALSGLNLNPSTVAGGSACIGTVSLNGPAVSGGVTVSLTTSSSTIANVPSTVTIPAGLLSATFNVVTSATTKQQTATIQATFGSVTLNATVTVTAPTIASVTLSPKLVVGGSPSSGTITLTGPAPTGGVTVKLASSSKSAIVPVTVLIAAGKSVGSFTANTTAVASQVNATITGSVGSVSQSATLSINPAFLVSVTLSPASVVGLTSSTATVTISGPAPTGGMPIQLASNQNSATVPATVTIPSGSTHTTFTVKTVSVPSQVNATISATLNGSTVLGTLTIGPPVLKSLTLSPASVKGGKTSTGTVTLGSAAPTGGIVVILKSGNSAATVSGSVTIAGGKTSGTFTVTTSTVSATTTSGISATFGGVTKSATLTITK